MLESSAREQATITVPTELRRPHAVVAATREAAKGVTSSDQAPPYIRPHEPQGDDRLEIGPESGVVHLRVSKTELRRVLLLLQALFAEAERRGHAVRPSDKGVGVVIEVAGHAYSISVTEQADRVPLSEAELKRLRRVFARQYRWGSFPEGDYFKQAL